VFAEPVKLDEHWEPRIVPKSDAEKAQIRKIVAGNILFTALDEDQLEIIIGAFEQKLFKQGDVLIKQGDMGDFFYILAEGTCDIFKNGVLVLQCVPGMGFGELALLYDSPRAATVQATSDVAVRVFHPPLSVLFFVYVLWGHCFSLFASPL
jgi:cAMP-dependent protein kinase regulator